MRKSLRIVIGVVLVGLAGALFVSKVKDEEMVDDYLEDTESEESEEV